MECTLRQAALDSVAKVHLPGIIGGGKGASLAIGFEVTQLGGRSLWLESVFAWRCSLRFIEVIGREGHVAQAEENLR